MRVGDKDGYLFARHNMYFILSGYWCARKHLTVQLINAGSITNITFCLTLPFRLTLHPFLWCGIHAWGVGVLS